MAEVTVVGVGPGNSDYLTRSAESAILNANVLIGGRRQLQLFDSLSIEKIQITSDLKPVLCLIRERAVKGDNVVVLASGDPGFYGILNTIKKRLPDLKVRVIPGISSVQAACAQLGITWDDAVLTSCHGRDITPLVKLVKDHNKVITLTGPKQNPKDIARVLLDGGTGNRTVMLACNISYQDETILNTDLKKLTKSNQNLYENCVMVIFGE